MEKNQSTESEQSENRQRIPDPRRFQVSKATLRLDSFMTRFIFFGGLSVILAIFGIFFFILAEILPLFEGATVKPRGVLETGEKEVLLLGTDEWSEFPFILDADGQLKFFAPDGSRPPKMEQAPVPQNTHITSAAYLQSQQAIALGMSNGSVLLGSVKYVPEFSEDGARRIMASVTWDPPQVLGETGKPVTDLDLEVSPSRKTIAGILGSGEEREAWVITLTQKRSLFGASGFNLDSRKEVTANLEGLPAQILVGSEAEAIVIRTDEDHVHFFIMNEGQWALRQTFDPFPNSGSHITSMNFIQGKVSLSFTDDQGTHLAYSLYRSEESGNRSFGLTKTFEPFPDGASLYAVSLRNKAFLIGNDQLLSLRYSTTQETRWETELQKQFQHLVINAKFDTILGIDADGKLSVFDLEDPHPEAGFRAFFSKIWYEGQNEPKFLWQSTGGSDDFEPKLSLIPLIVGSFKGTFYALIFAVPIALLGAIYTSQFLSPRLKQVIKPGIEIMASLPSVVLGFLAALWLAPLIEDDIPSVLLMCISIPATAVLFGYVWNLMPIRIRILIPKGWEFVIFLPAIILVSVAAWNMGPFLERITFSFTDPETGQRVADFRLWWEAWSGSQFQQRNSLVVGFMMGFAVIPIIYTISEDALSSVPPSLVSGSLALGASRWQTTARIVLPTASAGIFSGCMIGLGRAVGETMIVVMATGNTPILDFDIFSGMRTLSANIAVELPEAPHGGTLYRTLFLGAFVLFLLTFLVNTVAEVMRNRLRERFKVIN